MHKSPTPPPSDAAFLAQRDPAKIRQWLTRYLTELVEWSDDTDLLHAFETCWQFQDSGRAISYLVMGRNFEQACIYQFDPRCDCLCCTWEAMIGGKPWHLPDSHGAAETESVSEQALSALLQVKPLRQPLPGGSPVAADLFPQISR